MRVFRRLRHNDADTVVRSIRKIYFADMPVSGNANFDAQSKIVEKIFSEKTKLDFDDLLNGPRSPGRPSVYRTIDHA